MSGFRRSTPLPLAASTASISTKLESDGADGSLTATECVPAGAPSSTLPTATPPPHLQPQTHNKLSSNGTRSEITDTRAKLEAIREELEQLKRRREALEQQRTKLLAATLLPRRRENQPPERAQPPLQQSSRSKQQLLQHKQPSHSVSSNSNRDRPASWAVQSASQMSFMNPTTTSRMRVGGSYGNATVHSRAESCGSRRSASSLVGSLRQQQCDIICEQDRRERLKGNPYVAMKSAMHEAAGHDSMCLIGDFLLEDNAKVYTFGRAKRFQPLTGRDGTYFLDAKVQRAQSLSRSRRGSWHASELYSDDIPGPGAYTPRFNKISKPSPLASLLYY